MTYEIRQNELFNSREVVFDGKPSAETREALKALKMRWNPKKGCWYGYASENALVSAICGAEVTSDPEPVQVVTDGYMGGMAVYGNKSNLPLYGSDLSKAIRADIKAAGIKGVSVRCGRSTYTDHITVTITTERCDIVTPEEYREIFEISCSMHWLYIRGVDGKIEEIPVETYFNLPTASAQKKLKDQVASFEYEKEALGELDVNHYHIDKHKVFSPAGIRKLKAVLNIIGSYRYDESNSMVDYFNTNFYFSVHTKPGAWAENQK